MSTDEQGNEIGKLFVGGLHQSTSNDNLKGYFSKFGDVIEASVMMDHKTGRSRGFGYVRYTDNEAVLKVMAMKHNLDGKEIDPKPCNVNMKGRSRRSLKIFVGGIAPEHNEDTLRDFFKQFGNVTELTLMRDQSGHRHRGFAFVAFDDENVVKQLISDHFLQIGNKQVEIKPMEPQVNRTGNEIINKRGIGMNSMQAQQWPQQWTSANTASWPAAAAWNPYAQMQGNPGVGANMWDQGNNGWNGPTTWGGTNGNSNGLSRGPDMMHNPWETNMWNGNAALAASATMQHNQTSNNGWGPMGNGYMDQTHTNNQWNAAALAGGFSMPTNTGATDWRTNMSNGLNPINPQASMHGQPFAPFKR